MPWRLVNLGAVDGYTMVSLIKALKPGTPTLLLCYPEKPFVNVGYHQEVDREVNVDFCRKNEIDIVRRPMGGGTILDGPWEQDYFIFKKSGLDIRGFFTRYLEPIIDTLRYFGIPTSLKGNDILVGGRKISGNGAFSSGGIKVLAGDILMDIDTELAVNAIKVPDEKFRDKAFKSMEDHLTSLKKEGVPVKREELTDKLVDNFEKKFGEVYESNLSPEEWKEIERTRKILMSPEWIWRADRRIKKSMDSMRKLKIAGGHYVIQKDFKFEKLIRITACISQERIEDICISGDFFTTPPDLVEHIEREIKGRRFDDIGDSIKKAISEMDGKVMGFTPDDLTSAIVSLRRWVT